MTDYISREMTFDAICRLCNANFEEDPCEPSECEMMSLLREIPAADVRSVVRGRWEKGTGENGVTTSLFCSVCHYENRHWHEWNYCPNCGADMRAQPPKEE